MEIAGRYLNETFGNSHGQRPCTFFSSVDTDIQGDEDLENIDERDDARYSGVVPKSRNSYGGSEFWLASPFVSMAGKHDDEATISKLVKNHGDKYYKLC